MDFSGLVEVFTKNPGGTCAVALFLVVCFLGRALLKEKDDHRETAVALAPLASKLAEGVTALDSLHDRTDRHE